MRKTRQAYLAGELIKTKSLLDAVLKSHEKAMDQRDLLSDDVYSLWTECGKADRRLRILQRNLHRPDWCLRRIVKWRKLYRDNKPKLKSTP